LFTSRKSKSAKFESDASVALSFYDMLSNYVSILRVDLRIVVLVTTKPLMQNTLA